MKYFYILFFPLLPLISLADNLKTVQAEYVYYAPENITIEEAKRIAIDRAKIQAIADAFGTIISQTNTTRVENGDGKSKVDFLSTGGSDVKGDWIETIGEPSISIQYEQGVMIIKVSIKGKARELSSSVIDIQTTILRNGVDENAASNEFKDGDDLYLRFLSPVDGYLSVYLVDNEDKAYCLLPYRKQKDGIYGIKSNRQYLFFKASEVEAKEREIVDEYSLTCSRSTEYNYIHVLFSPNPYTKVADNSSGESLPRELTNEKFQKWLQNLRKRDVDFQCRTFVIHISK